MIIFAPPSNTSPKNITTKSNGWRHNAEGILSTKKAKSTEFVIKTNDKLGFQVIFHSFVRSIH